MAVLVCWFVGLRCPIRGGREQTLAVIVQFFTHDLGIDGFSFLFVGDDARADCSALLFSSLACYRKGIAETEMPEEAARKQSKMPSIRTMTVPRPSVRAVPENGRDGGTDELAKLLPRQTPNGPTSPASPMTPTPSNQVGPGFSAGKRQSWAPPLLLAPGSLLLVRQRGAGRLSSLEMPGLWRGEKHQSCIMNQEMSTSLARLDCSTTDSHRRDGSEHSRQGGALRGFGSDLGRATTTILLCARVGAVEKGRFGMETLSRVQRVEENNCFFFPRENPGFHLEQAINSPSQFSIFSIFIAVRGPQSGQFV